MILANGTVFPPSEQGRLLARLEASVSHTLATQTLPYGIVIDAIDTLGEKIRSGFFDAVLAAFSIVDLSQSINAMLLLLKKEALAYKVATELGEHFFTPYTTMPPSGQKSMTVQPMPLGTLLHIAAGNIDGLPAFSVVEGLLTGNINILKLPQADNGLSILILTELIKIEPRLRDFIYVFDTPSADIDAMKKMAEISDGIVVWGGDSAVAAVRRLAPQGVKLIEWGHKLSFAYISGYENKIHELKALAAHILATKQLLCSSCQTIFLNTEDMAELHAFCTEFLPYLEAAAAVHPASVGETAEATLRKYTDTLEQALETGNAPSRPVFQGSRCSLTVCSDNELELSYMFGSCLVKCLPKNKIFSCLRKHKHHLQTVGLICSPEQRAELSDIFARCGLVRIMRAGTMSDYFSGEAHDGEYPLRRYTRIVNIE